MLNFGGKGLLLLYVSHPLSFLLSGVCCAFANQAIQAVWPFAEGKAKQIPSKILVSSRNLALDATLSLKPRPRLCLNTSLPGIVVDVPELFCIHI